MRDPRTHDVLQSAIALHRELGPGLLESTYRRLLANELRRAGHAVDEERPIPVVWRGERIDVAYRADLVVDDAVLVEVKAVETVPRVATRQVLTYLRWGGFRVGLLINFGEYRLTDGVRRYVL